MDKMIALTFVLILGCHQQYCNAKMTGNPSEKNDGEVMITDDSFECNYFCDMPSNNDSGYIPPSYNHPCTPDEILPVYITGPDEKSIQIPWTEPTAFDMNGTLLKNEQIIGSENGPHFNGSVDGIVHHIVYIATDENGLKDSCHFSFTVYESMNCSTPSVVENGRYECTNGSMPGSTCTYKCNEGYTLVGDASTTCLLKNHTSPDWSRNPVCKAVQCSEPIKPDYGYISCLTTSYSYPTVCQITCQEGFTAEGPLIMKCQANGLWSRTTVCTFPEPLAARCISPQTFYTSPQQTSMEVYWKGPTSAAIDNNITRIHQTKGPNQGDVLALGRYTVSYQISTNGSEKTAECDVQLYIKAVLCEEPTRSFNDSNMIHNCSLPTLILGTTCLLSCKEHTGTELIGNPTVTCVNNGMNKGVWESAGNENTFCNETLLQCPQNIKMLVNGEILYHDNDTTPIAQVICYSGFNLNYGFSGNISCSDGKWEYGQILECNAEQTPNYELQVELKFFGKYCSENASIYYEEYKERFKKDFEIVLSQNCSNDLICSVNNVIIECSNSSKQKKIGDPYHFDHMFYIGFSIGVKVAKNTSEDLVDFQENVVNQLWKSYRHWVVSTTIGMLHVEGSFVVETWETNNFTIPVCKEDYIMYNQQCRTCSAGTYFNATEDVCRDCPLGYYKDSFGLTSCVPCPLGSSTKTIGSYTIQNCKDFCPPGSVSSDGLESCVLCPQGQYQDISGQTECKKCPKGTTTILINSTNINNCTAIKSDSECMTSSCNGHRCLNTNGSYVCVCSDGWSGDSCDNPPNPCSDNACMNGGDCINKNKSYACDCKANFVGFLCEAKSVNGGWTEWTRWSKCSATCGLGVKQRTRDCRNPLPSKHGDQCNGVFSERKSCDMDICRECQRLVDGKDFYYHCKTNLPSGIKECSARCNIGLIFLPSFNELRNLSCGLQTGLTWIPGNVAVPCVKQLYPLSLHLEASIAYLQPMPTQFYYSASEQVHNKLQSTDCFDSPTCEVNVTLQERPLSNNKNDAVRRTTLLAFFENTIKSSNRGKSTVDDSANIVLEHRSKLKAMESSALLLVENTNLMFDIQVGSDDDKKVYGADVETLTIKGGVSCLPGQIPYNSLCIPCPSGTFAGYDRCHLCIKGTFQPFEGQTRCLYCPAGLTTISVGSYHEMQCVEDTSETITEKRKTSSGKTHLDTILGSVLGPLGAIAVAVTIKLTRGYTRNKCKGKGKGGTLQKVLQYIGRNSESSV